MAVSHLLNCAPRRSTFRGNLRTIFLLVHLADQLLHTIRISITKRSYHDSSISKDIFKFDSFQYHSMPLSQMWTSRGSDPIEVMLKRILDLPTPAANGLKSKILLCLPTASICLDLSRPAAMSLKSRIAVYRPTCLDLLRFAQPSCQ